MWPDNRLLWGRNEGMAGARIERLWNSRNPVRPLFEAFTNPRLSDYRGKAQERALTSISDDRDLGYFLTIQYLEAFQFLLGLA